MKFKFVSLLVLSGLILSGCITMSLTFKYPQDIKADCIRAKAEAKASIESKGKKLRERKSLNVEKVAGQKVFSGYWAFWSEDWKQYVCGLCESSSSKINIKVASDPKTGKINFNVLKHENAHYWLISNYNDYWHNPVYSSLFFNWVNATTKAIVTNKEGNIVIIDIPPDRNESIKIKELKVIWKDRDMIFKLD